MARTSRPTPRELCVNWPDRISTDEVGEVARRFAVNLVRAIEGRSLRSVAEETGVGHASLSRIIDGRLWPDMYTVARLELGLGAALWPDR
jgi:uncharacterized protein YerC